MAESFREALKSDKFIITSEIGPPKGTNIDNMRHHIDLLKDRVDGINVTDHQSSVMRFPSIGGCLEIKEHGGEPILQ
ncbi:MAG: 5,10-methylenetetrahydrofolate reductase, partial [Chloroflexota bacterium]|nr:5,10-methylenetetrahydrofolate reductase [Chloroflexota bacterium]